MNIGIVTSTYLPTIGGIQFLLYWLLKAIDRNEYLSEIGKVYAIVPSDPSLKCYHKFKNISIIEYNQSLWSIKGALSFIPQLESIVNSYSLSLLHSFNSMPEGLCCLGTRIKIGIPYVVSCHGEDIALDQRFDYGNRSRKVMAWMTCMTLRGAKMITTVGSDMARFAKEAGALSRRIRIIPNGIELKTRLFKTDVINIVDDLRRRYSINDAQTVYLTLSGMRKIKGHAALVRSFAEALIVNPNLRLFIGAHGLETQALKNLVRSLNVEKKVAFIGFVTGIEKRAWFKLADVYCNTAFFEPFGIVYLEAILHRVAVLGSIFGGGKDIFCHGKNAWLVDPWNENEIFKALLTLSDPNIRKKLVEASKDLLPVYDIDRIAEKYLMLYRDIAIL